MLKVEALDIPEITIERIFLWNEAIEIIRNHAFIAGLQASLDDGSETNVVLAGELVEGDNAKLSVELWARWAGGIGIHEISVTFDDPDTQDVDFLYEITPSYLCQYALNPTPLDQEDIYDLRSDLNEVIWDAGRSATSAATKILF